MIQKIFFMVAKNLAVYMKIGTVISHFELCNIADKKYMINITKSTINNQ